MRSLPTPSPPALVLSSIIAVQFGGALASTLIPTIGAVGSVALRLGFAAVILCALGRPALTGRSRTDWLVVTGYAATLATMNVCFYASLAHLPLGVAVTCEFIGPLTLAAVLSRQARDLVAVLFALVGVLLVSGALTTTWSELPVTGVLLALAAGGCWAAYIIASRATGAHFASLDGLAIALAMGTVAVLPLGIWTAGSALFTWDALVKGVGIAVLSSVLPYSMELLALRRLSPQIFGILLSLEPAAGAIAGLIVLGQRLGWLEVAGMALVVCASVIVLGAARRSGSDDGAGPDLAEGLTPV